jgi:hypothetical protein
MGTELAGRGSQIDPSSQSVPIGRILQALRFRKAGISAFFVFDQALDRPTQADTLYLFSE